MLRCPGCAIPAAFKNSRGLLYPFENRMYYITKPPMHIPYDKIAHIEFQRYTGAPGGSMSFDIEVQLKVSDCSILCFTSFRRRNTLELEIFR